MVFKAVVHNGAIELPTDVRLPDGTIVNVEAPEPKRFEDLLELAGTWEGNDADRIIEEIYASRSSAPPRVTFDP